MHSTGGLPKPFSSPMEALPHVYATMIVCLNIIIFVIIIIVSSRSISISIISSITPMEALSRQSTAAPAAAIAGMASFSSLREMGNMFTDMFYMFTDYLLVTTIVNAYDYSSRHGLVELPEEKRESVAI